VEAYFARKDAGPFFCLTCGDEVILRTGNSRLQHFAHVNPFACRLAQSESDDHLRCKLEIFHELSQIPGVTRVALERPLGTVRPDVSAYIHGVPVAIEVQISSLSIETIMQRTIEYHRKGIFVLWLMVWTPELDQPRYAPNQWERWLHAAYFGRVYYWRGGLNVVSYHFEPCFRKIEQKTWFGPGGKKVQGGGFSVRSKRYRTAVRGKGFNIERDFRPRERTWWEGNGIKVPDAKLFMER